MKISRLANIKISAPAVVMLAAAVNTALAGECALELPETSVPDLSWAVRGGATHSVHSARVYLAHKATTAIYSIDRLCGACAEYVFISASGHAVPSGPAWTSLRQDSSPFSFMHSTHQHSAP